MQAIPVEYNTGDGVSQGGSMVLENPPSEKPGYASQMQAIPVEYNTGDGVSQGGSMVLENPPSEKPGYASRLAPFFVYDCLIPNEFFVYDCLIPNENNIFSVTEERAAIYICLKPVSSITPGIYSFSLKAHMSEGVYTCRISIHIYDVSIPEDTFPVTNWFSYL